jgi:hypothetical protein
MVLPGETVGTGAELPEPGARLQVMESAAGFYWGYRDVDGCPWSRESGYYRCVEDAEAAMDRGVVSWR